MQKAVKEVICVLQVANLEDELLCSCNIRNVQELTNSKSERDFKRDFKRDLLRCTNLEYRLKQCDFSIDKLWSRIPQNKFKEFGNGAEKLKLYE